MSGCISIEDPNYPKRLKKIRKPPKELFYKGNFDPDIFKNCLSVVGSRRITTYGKVVTQKLIPPLVGAGITIVSGFMYGVDAHAHMSCLNSKGKTIAVMPCGIDCVFPEDQGDLYKSILDNNGLIVSEYEGDLKPQIWMFPQRNRIVAGLSKATLIVEAGIDSGSLITASYAKEYERKVFVVPGDIFSENSQGIYHLIEDGASIVTSSFDILDFYQFHPGYRESNGTLFGSIGESNSTRAKILEALKREAFTTDELTRYLHLSFEMVSSELTLMNLDGQVFQEGDRYYVT